MRRYSGYVVLASVSIVLAACSKSPGPPSPPQSVSVQSTKVKRENISHIVTAARTLYPLDEAVITPKITAPVQKFYVNRGDRVHKGQLLAVLENSDLAAAATGAEGAFDKAQANYHAVVATSLPEQLQTAEASLENAQANLDAQKKLYESNLWLYQQKAHARKQLDQAKVALTAAETQYRTAKSKLQNLQNAGKSEQLNSAEGQLEAARGQYLSAEAQLKYSMIRSPIAGVVADRSVYPGQIATAGNPLLRIVDASKVIARLYVPETDAGLLKVGDPANLRLPGTKTTVPAKITVFSPALDPNSTSVQIWVQANNPHHELQPGTSVEASLTARTVQNALVVPLSSIVQGPNGNSAVMVIDHSGHVHRHDVVTGIQQNGSTQILSGLEEGEEIVSTGAYGLPDGTKVIPAKPAGGA